MEGFKSLVRVEDCGVEGVGGWIEVTIWGSEDFRQCELLGPSGVFRWVIHSPSPTTSLNP